MTGNPECDTLWSGSHIQKRLHDPSCSPWEEEGDQRRLGGEELEVEPVTLDRCIVTDLDWKPWSVVECFIKTTQHVSVLHSVAAASLHVGETNNVGKWLNSSCLVFHACLLFSSYKVGMLRLGHCECLWEGICDIAKGTDKTMPRSEQPC